MNGKLRTLLTAAGSAALLAACAVGPKAPLPTIPAEGQGARVGFRLPLNTIEISP